MDESAVTDLAKDELHQRLRELVVPQRPTTLDQLRKQAILAKDAVDVKGSTSNPISSADSQTKSMDSKLVAIQTAIMNIMPASANQHRQNEEVHAVTLCTVLAPNTSGPATINFPDLEVPACDMLIRPILITHCTDFNSKCSYCGNIGHLTQVCHSRLLENATKFQRSS